MKKDWILWNALQKPEKITADERMEQIEWKSYYWCYKAMLQILWIMLCIWPFLRGILLEQKRTSTGAWNILILIMVISIEAGRFLYNCYYGNQEFYDRNSGKSNFLLIGLLTGGTTWIVFWFFYGVKHPLPWVMLTAGSLFYWGLCHLAYLHFALLSDEDTEEKGRKSESWIPGVCGVLLAFYFLFLEILGFQFVFRAEDLANASLGETEKEWIREIEHGKEAYEYLESCKIEYRFQTTPESENLVNENGDMAHALHWITPDSIYTQVLDSGSSDTVCEEYYFGENGMWNKAIEGRWVSEDDWREINDKAGIEPQEWWAYYPYTGIPPVNPRAVISIEKERQGQEVSYTVHYTEDYKPWGTTLHDQADVENISVTVRYILNNYRVLTGYECTETGTDAGTGEELVNHRSFRILNVDSVENQQEIESLIRQYGN